LNDFGKESMSTQAISILDKRIVKLTVTGLRHSHPLNPLPAILCGSEMLWFLSRSVFRPLP